MNKYLRMFPEEDKQAVAHDGKRLYQGMSMLHGKELVTIALHAIHKRHLRKMQENDLKPFTCLLRYLRNYLLHLQEKQSKEREKTRRRR